jgi:hypothetical protein
MIMRGERCLAAASHQEESLLEYSSYSMIAPKSKLDFDLKLFLAHNARIWVTLTMS